MLTKFLFDMNHNHTSHEEMERRGGVVVPTIGEPDRGQWSEKQGQQLAHSFLSVYGY